MRKENLKRKGTENGGENEENDASPADLEKADDEQEAVANGKENGDSKKGSTSDDDFEDAETGEKDDAKKIKDGANESGDDDEEDKEKDDEDSEPLAKKSKKSESGKKGKKPAKAAKAAVKTKAAKKAKVEENNAKEEEDDEEEEYEVQDIIDHRKERGGKLVYRIRWKNYGEDDDTWEPEDTLSCPDIIKKYKAKMEKEESSATPAKKGKPAKGGSAKKKGKKPAPKKAAKAAEADSDVDGDEEEDNTEYEVEKIIDVHFKRDGKREYLVRWKGFSSKDDTWEPADNLNCSNLIDKFNEKLDKSKNASVKELRVERKPTNRLSLNLGGRKNSRRNASRARVTYYDGE
ncbi:heterochromatin protein 1-like [Wyeomyia smithii]|uniref:heterochromatin protein 1-like n=1 Tax=Wyeomyia smithii TaxID=174621 RepID=UPI002467BD19|nr:heterochromatin protein 1-like [Wyeomyia smithii]